LLKGNSHGMLQTLGRLSTVVRLTNPNLQHTMGVPFQQATAFHNHNGQLQQQQQNRTRY
jgi:hypothetical protein